MASQSLYRKWRSQTFSDLVGQEKIVQTLKNALSSGNPAHAYLFTGPRGTGKTSSARLLAKTINCLQPKDGEPCNQCQQCREITAGNSFNVIEIDAASNRGIDNIRELRDKVSMPPVTGKYKVYILDEAHMLTTEAFNALLKTLEEPPKHAIIVMATTEVHKLLPTVLSRCQRFDFKRITTQQIVKHLNFIAEQERVKLDPGAAELIARAAAGGMRDALSLLDQAIAYAGQEIVLAQVQTMLGVADPQVIQKLILHVAYLDSAASLHLIHELADAGADLRQINSQVGEYWRAMMLAKAGADIVTILDCTDNEVREVTQAAESFKLDELIECARIFAQNDLMQKNQGSPQLGLELAFLSCIDLHRRSQVGQAGAIPSQSVTLAPPVRISPAHSPARPTTTRPQPVVTSENLPLSTPVTQTPPAKVSADGPSALPDWDDIALVDDEPGVYEPEPRNNTRVVQLPPASSPSSDESNELPSLTIQQLKEKWEFIKRRVKTQPNGAKIAAILNGYTIIEIGGTKDLPVVAIKANDKFHYDSLQQADRYKLVEWALKLELNQEFRVRLVPPGQSLSLAKPSELTPFQSPKPNDSSSRSANTTSTIASQQSAHRERTSPEMKTSPSSSSQESEPEMLQRQETRITAVGDKKLPLARSQVVRENTIKTTADMGESHKEMIKQKAKNDPVVQEVVRMFKANIKEIQSK